MTTEEKDITIKEPVCPDYDWVWQAAIKATRDAKIIYTKA